jgi:hypothetical protein
MVAVMVAMVMAAVVSPPEMVSTVGVGVLPVMVSTVPTMPTMVVSPMVPPVVATPTVRERQ